MACFSNWVNKMELEAPCQLLHPGMLHQRRHSWNLSTRATTPVVQGVETCVPKRQAEPPPRIQASNPSMLCCYVNRRLPRAGPGCGCCFCWFTEVYQQWEWISSVLVAGSFKKWCSNSFWQKVVKPLRAPQHVYWISISVQHPRKYLRHLISSKLEARRDTAQILPDPTFSSSSLVSGVFCFWLTCVSRHQPANPSCCRADKTQGPHPRDERRSGGESRKVPSCQAWQIMRLEINKSEAISMAALGTCWCTLAM